MQMLNGVKVFFHPWHDTVQIMHCEGKCIWDMFTTVEQGSLPKDGGVENKGRRSVKTRQNDKIFGGLVNKGIEKSESKNWFNFLFEKNKYEIISWG